MNVLATSAYLCRICSLHVWQGHIASKHHRFLVHVGVKTRCWISCSSPTRTASPRRVRVHDYTGLGSVLFSLATSCRTLAPTRQHKSFSNIQHGHRRPAHGRCAGSRARSLAFACAASTCSHRARPTRNSPPEAICRCDCARVEDVQLQQFRLMLPYTCEGSAW